MEIITADGCKKNEPVIVTGNVQKQQMTALPGHQNRAKRNINTTEKKKIENFPDPDQCLSILIYYYSTGCSCIAVVHILVNENEAKITGIIFSVDAIFDVLPSE